MPVAPHSDREVAEALCRLLPGASWEAVALARGFLASSGGATDEKAVSAIREGSRIAPGRARTLLARSKTDGLLATFKERERKGSAENAAPKLFPARITEQRFAELLESLISDRSTVKCEDERDTGEYTLADYSLCELSDRLPINVKNAGTRFTNAQALVGLDPDDCIPIPAYKAFGAIESDSYSSLVYVCSVDFELARRVGEVLKETLTDEETLVWGILNDYTGSGVKAAEDQFVSLTVSKYWERFQKAASNTPFVAISARRAIRILKTKPRRTPGLGLKAWGTGVSGEVNVHVSIKEDMTPWETVRDRIVSKGVGDILRAVGRRRQEWVDDPEI
jgi:hypothetical protein